MRSRERAKLLARLPLALAVVGLAIATAACGGESGAGEAEVNVSTSPGSEAETAIAADASGRVLLVGASTQGRGDRGLVMRAYSSTDAGRTWAISRPLTESGNRCGHSDPVPAVAADDRQYVTFLVGRCGPTSEEDLEASLDVYVATRAAAGGRWSGTTLTPRSDRILDDKPTIAVDRSASSPHRGRVYAAWSRRPGTPQDTVRIAISHSDDGGRTWTTPSLVAGIANEADSYYASLSIAADGSVFLAWFDVRRIVNLSRSEDGGLTFSAPGKVADAVALPSGDCEVAGVAIPAQPERCVTINPNVAVGKDRLLVSWATAGADGLEQDIFVRAYDLNLGPLGGPVQVNPADGTEVSDQFNPALAYDASGLFWVCYYDTSGDPARKRARFACSLSNDGGTSWQGPSDVASVASDLSKGNVGIKGPSGGAFAYGDYEGVVAVDGIAHPVWTDARNRGAPGTDIYTASVLARDVER